MLKTQIKISHVNNLTDARYFAAWGAEWLGFDLNEGSEHFVHPTKVKEIMGWVEGPKIVGEFILQSPSEIQNIVTELNLDAVQVGSFSNLAFLEKIQNLNIIKEVIIDQDTALEEKLKALENETDFVNSFLLNFDKNNITWSNLKNQNSNSIKALRSFCGKYSCILSIKINPSNAIEILHQINPIGINIKGGAEEKVGFKSFEELDDLFEVLEVD